MRSPGTPGFFNFPPNVLKPEKNFIKSNNTRLTKFTIMEVLELDVSWIAGNYPDVNAEINTRLPYVAIDDFFWQGEEADEVINEIHQIWVQGDITVQEAIQKWSFSMLY